MRSFADQLFTQVGVQLGPDGDGPLSRALASFLQRATGAIVQGAFGRVCRTMSPFTRAPGTDEATTMSCAA